MAAKFSMANTSGRFDSAAHVEASDRMQNAMEELQVKNERQEKTRTKQLEQQENEEKQRAHRVEEALEAKAAHWQEDRTYVGKSKEEEEEELDSDNETVLDDLDKDPELKRIRAMRLKQLKLEYEEKQKLVAKGHGEYREILQDEFLKEVTSSPLVAVHFYHRDFERCKIMDMHLAKLAPRHIECKFLKLNAEEAPFFVEKLAIRVLPSIVCFKDGVAFRQRVIGFEGLMQDNEEAELMKFGSRSSHHASSMNDFLTTALARKLVDIGAIREHDDK